MKIRPCTIRGDVCLIPLSRGMTAVVDADDFDIVSPYNWAALQNRRLFYAKRSKAWGRPSRLHRFLLDDPASQIDHIDGDGLNNRRANLRLCTNSQNQGNQRNQRRQVGASIFRGVCKHRNKWVAKIAPNRTYLGAFASETEAALAYDRAAIAHFGEFASLNFPRAVTA